MTSEAIDDIIKILKKGGWHMENKSGADDPIVFQNTFYDTQSGELINPIYTKNYGIIQVADSFYPSEFYIKPHTQCCEVEITFVASGSMKISAEENDAELKRGEAHLCFFGERHALLCRGGVRFQTLAFNLTEDSIAAELVKSIRAAGKRVYETRRLFDLFSNVLSEFHDTGFTFRLFSLDTLISSILLDVASTSGRKNTKAKYSPDELAAKALNHIDKNLGQSAGLTELSSRLGYSYNHIYKNFKRHTGESLCAYSLRVKLERAKEMLLDGRSISEVSASVGYSNPYNFSRAFKSFFGISPSRVKKSESET